jgi:peptidoglycan/LPS O-acetylase OafA/YrhL
MSQRNFDGFYGLRYICILCIIVPHLFAIGCDFGVCAGSMPSMIALGTFALQFFFVASAFLITFLLLAEQEKTGRISIRYFFLRRILRIWPAYYLLLLIVILIVHQWHFFDIPTASAAYTGSIASKCNSLYFFFLPHVVPFYISMPPYLHHTYTIGIEEQFYFLWGILFLLLRRHRSIFFLSLIFLMPLLAAIHFFLNNHASPEGAARLFSQGITYLQYSRISTFAIGAFLGYSYFYRRTWIDVFQRKDLQLVLYAIIVGWLWFAPVLPFIQLELIALLAGFVMLAASFPATSLVPYHTKWLVFLGHRSYGIYLFHIIAVVLAIKTASSAHLSGWAWWLAVCLLSVMLATLFGWISYDAFEKHFLKLKDRFKRL